MSKTKRLELENQALKNVIACIREELDELESREISATVGRISGIIKSSDHMIELAVNRGYAMDYREHKEKEPGSRNCQGSIG